MTDHLSPCIPSRSNIWRFQRYGCGCEIVPWSWERRSFLRGIRQRGVVARSIRSKNLVRVDQQSVSIKACSLCYLILHWVCARRLTGRINSRNQYRASSNARNSRQRMRLKKKAKDATPGSLRWPSLAHTVTLVARRVKLVIVHGSCINPSSGLLLCSPRALAWWLAGRPSCARHRLPVQLHCKPYQSGLTSTYRPWMGNMNKPSRWLHFAGINALQSHALPWRSSHNHWG